MISALQQVETAHRKAQAIALPSVALAIIALLFSNIQTFIKSPRVEIDPMWIASGLFAAFAVAVSF